jgi:SH3-like domain-containing protein
MKALIALMLLLAANVAQAAPEPSILNPSGLPVPRFVALKSNEINVRVGPGTRYPIRFIYRRKGLPVQIVEEFAHWRKIADHKGEGGWVHKGMIEGARTAMILDNTQNLYAKPSSESRVVMRAEASVIGTLIACEPDWCELQIERRKGWIRKSTIWGVTREEVLVAD